MLSRSELPGAADDRLFFAQVREDPLMELAAFEKTIARPGPIAVVSSAGCTALSLVAAGAPEVVGIDLNRTQNHLVELKAAAITVLEPAQATTLLGGGPLPAAERLRRYELLRGELTPAARRYWDGRRGRVARGVLDAGVTERLMRLISWTVRRLVHSPARVDRLLALDGIAKQRAFYESEWDGRRWRLLFRVLCNRFVLRRAYDPSFFAHVENPSFATHFTHVVGRTLTGLPVRDNYFLHHILTGRYPAIGPDGLPPYLAGRVPAPTGRLALVDGSFTDFLRRRPDGGPGEGVAGFALSNICEWLTPDQIDELFGEIVRTARPGARLVFRNFVGWTEVPERWRGVVREDRALGEKLIRRDRSLCQRRIAVCDVLK
jgi:S-adenosylmethionine-diacylglycerol 3-amino-3-carboxypropyl transferase